MHDTYNGAELTQQTNESGKHQMELIGCLMPQEDKISLKILKMNELAKGMHGVREVSRSVKCKKMQKTSCDEKFRSAYCHSVINYLAIAIGFTSSQKLYYF